MLLRSWRCMGSKTTPENPFGKGTGVTFVAGMCKICPSTPLFIKVITNNPLLSIDISLVIKNKDQVSQLGTNRLLFTFQQLLFSYWRRLGICYNIYCNYFSLWITIYIYLPHWWILARKYLSWIKKINLMRNPFNVLNCNILF